VDDRQHDLFGFRREVVSEHMLTDDRGWTPDEYQRWLGDMWIRLLSPSDRDSDSPEGPRKVGSLRSS
jgi:hypothetical protein